MGTSYGRTPPKKNLLFEQIYVIISESTLIVVAPLSANEWVGMKWTFLADRSWGSYDICIHICLLAECVLCATEYIVRLMCLLDSLSFSKYKLITIYKESLVCFVFFLFWCVRSLFWKRFNNLARISSGEKKSHNNNSGQSKQSDSNFPVQIVINENGIGAELLFHSETNGIHIQN